MRKLIGLAVVGALVIGFVGTDVFSSVFHSARSAVRDALTAEVPLETQLAEAQAQVDAYAESIIRGEVAAENLKDMIDGVAREVRGLDARVTREARALAALRDGLDGARDGTLVPADYAPVATEDAGVLRRVRAFEAAGDLLTRRRGDLERLQQEHAATLGSLESARTEQARLSEEVRVLAAEIQSLDARKAAARTRHAVGDGGLSASGYAEARDRIQKIRAQIREQNKLIQYYEYERVVRDGPLADDALAAAPADARTAIDEALARHAGGR
jgi:chromosome segregation ATPase